MNDIRAPWYVWLAELVVFLALLVGIMAVVLVAGAGMGA